ncbi:exodeoxyribonuclease V alpha subunit [Rhodoblastus acidophilus]|uniref:ATP-dependent RecD2 DNA helicase n=1 Tax=Rhodoblastus acidophilus TaxID=1074 RepID=A0A212SG42_RHOAC|nr:ATP-dependent RecD-like DNA helicase [Rhodoblastus acidophilus]PPQ34808.1 ATP-dependent RecD-like DNA helicase [Rhodoblastus acidophilus]RAI16508.1 ATP-dependent RecD-like DNA helicase [Rhodoblastus acidophilus]SNB84673.1 exodeoxyribonuclease V alpha subunit [Rhodoblastus acidophilus]
MASAPEAPHKETLVGSVERVTFHNEDNGFAVLKVKVRGQRDLVPVVGHAASISAGEFIHAVGVWFTDRTHGLQFKADFLKTTPPTTAEGIEKYLGSGMVRGIGPKLAQRIVAAFGVGTFEIIEAEPTRLREVSGIGEMRAARIAAGWAEQKAVRDIMVFLHANGVGTSRAVRIFKTYGHDAIQVMTENPYRLARDIRGIGFRTADAIAMRLGLTKESPQRLRAGVSFALQEATDDGHCGLPRAELIHLATDLLDVPARPIEAALAEELSAGEVVADAIEGTDCIFLRGLYVAERGVADRLLSLCDGAPPWPRIDATVAVGWVEKKTGKTLAASQRAAVTMALQSKVVVVTGGPGVGKTTLLDAILRILTAKRTKILLAAPTGRAAKRMTEQTGMEAKTIHRLLETDPKEGGFKRGADNPLDCDLLVVDEASMIDAPLMFALLKALPTTSGLMLVGDVDQLPSVGPGRVLADIIESGALPVARLTEVFRQAAESRIVVGAHRINEGKMPEWPRRSEDADFFFVEAATPEEGAAKVVEIVRDRIPRRFGMDAVGDVQVLCPMQRGALGARSLNADLQKALNPNPSDKIERFGSVFAPGDKIMQTENDYDREVFNGDLGRVARIDREEGALVASFDGREVTYAFGELDAVVPAYATTIHKSQGSEYPAVVITLATQHYTMLARNLVYTAVTRGKRLVVIVGQKRALAIAVRNARANKRWTRLKQWLAARA